MILFNKVVLTKNYYNPILLHCLHLIAYNIIYFHLLQLQHNILSMPESNTHLAHIIINQDPEHDQELIDIT